MIFTQKQIDAIERDLQYHAELSRLNKELDECPLQLKIEELEDCVDSSWDELEELGLVWSLGQQEWQLAQQEK